MLPFKSSSALVVFIVFVFARGAFTYIRLFLNEVDEDSLRNCHLGLATIDFLWLYNDYAWVALSFLLHLVLTLGVNPCF